MNDDQLLRYSRHILLDEIGIEGQQRLLDARALVIGAGGLGSAALMYLASAGVGRLTIVDHDRVDLTNLQRQIVHGQDRIGQPKAASAAHTLAGLNDGIALTVLTERVDAARLLELAGEVDVVLDCSDNFATRHAVNAACVARRVPLVSGAAVRFDAQLSVYDVRGDGPCYACVFPADAAFEDVACSTMGVFAPLVGIIGSMQAAEALKLLSGAGESLAGRLQMLDARAMAWSEIRIHRDPACPVCATAHR